VKREICGEKISNVIAEASVAQHNYSVYAVTIQEKVALENRIESTTSRVKRTTWWTGLMTSQRRSEDAPAADTAAVCAYKKLLEQNVASVNNYRFTNKPKRNSFTHTKEFLTIYI
jgi:hypothetical protein